MISLLSTLYTVVKAFLKSPAERRHEVLAKVRAAFATDKDAGNDTSTIEDLVNH